MNHSKSDSCLLENNGPAENGGGVLRLNRNDVPRNECPRNHASWFSLLSLWWLNDLFKKRKKKALQIKDIYEVLPYHSSRYLHQKVKGRVNEYAVKNGRFTFLLRCLLLFRSNVLFLTCMLFSYEVTRIIIPILLGKLLFYFEDKEKLEQLKAFGVTVGFAAANLIFVTCSTFMWQEANVIGMRFRVAFTGLIYEKILKLGIEKQRDITSGKIITLLSSDLEKFNGYGIGYIPYCVLGPLSCIIVTIIIAQDIGVFAALSVPAAGMLLLILPAIASTFEGKLWKRTVPLTDARVQLMNEIVTGMKLIKMYVWEKPFMKLIKQKRGAEMLMKMKGYLLRSFSRSFSLVVVKCMILSAFSVAVLTSYYRNLSVAILFKTIGLINVMLWAFVSNTTISVFYINQLTQCIGRLQAFLREDDGTLIQELSDSDGDNSNNRIEVSGLNSFCINNGKQSNSSESNGDRETAPLTASAVPPGDKRHVALENISLELLDGQLAGVCGRIGSGKSTLLHVLLKETSFTARVFKTRGTISYAPQEAWIFNDSVRENILFGAKYDDRKFWKIVRVCALEQDIEDMANGEWTLVGERGLMMSGGQKARINLARALYRDADIYLLDDPLSAVDTKVGRHIYNECIKKYLDDKTVVLVTHQRHYLENVDTLLVLDNGRITFHGKYDKQMESYIEKPERKETIRPEDNDVVLQTEEEKEGGSVSWRIYYQYITHGSRIQFVLVYLCFGIALWLHIYTDWILGSYTKTLKDRDSSNIESSDHQVIKKVGLFILLIFFLDFVRNLLGNLFIVRASQNLHNKMFEKVMQAPMRFFDVNPAGRVLNRFSRDLAFVDDDMANQLPAFVMCVGGSLAAVVIPIFTVVWSIIAIVPLVALLIYFLLRANPVIRDMKRLEATARSPIYTHISDTISGLLSIRAFKEQEAFMEKLHDFSDNHTRAWYLYINSQLWLGLRLNWLMAIFISIVAIISVPMSKYIDDISLIGVTLMHSCANLDNFEYTFRSANAIEVIMTSVERILHYTKLETEGKKTLMGKLDKEIENEWPKDGSLEFKDVSLKYTEDSPNALSDLNFVIPHAQKVGVVGRTGAGKSSLLSALFRLAEPNGNILIDGVDITTLPLQIARFQLSVIPQDPFIFAGTVRRNVDPLNMHDDDELWDVLSKVQLRSKVEGMEGFLEARITESGGNLSVGERQLICLARALLKKSTILVLDEATANVDDETDAIIQKVIRKYFAHCTLITIAHRLNTIMDYDRIFVLDSGKIVEMGTPNDLLRTEGVFKQLASKMHSSKLQTVL